MYYLLTGLLDANSAGAFLCFFLGRTVEEFLSEFRPMDTIHALRISKEGNY